MKKCITIISLMISIGLMAQSSFGEIKGKVKEESNQSAMPFVNVWVESNGTKIGAVTDENGKFTIKPLSPGIYDVSASFIGYQTTILKSVTVNADQITFTDAISLNEQGKDILPVFEVEATTSLLETDSHNKVAINSKSIIQSPVRTNINKLAGSTGSVQVSEDGDDVYFRGARKGDLIYLVDGVKITGSRPVLPSAGIQSISVYSGGLPAKYGDTTGGVIAVETKSYFDMYYESLRKQ